MTLVHALRYFWLVVLLAVSCVARADDLDPQEVRTAIRDGISFLKSRQSRRGNWAAVSAQKGVSALCTLALLNSGVPVDDEVMQRALTYLVSEKYENTYGVSLQTMVFCTADPARYLVQIRRNVKWLESAQKKSGLHAGGWQYTQTPPAADNSNSQFALLALYEADRAARELGMDSLVDSKTWKLAHDYWIKGQNGDGSWGYIVQDQNGTGSMTCAGIAATILARNRLLPGDARVTDGQVICCGNQTDDDAVERGLQWLARNFDVNVNPGSRSLYYFYYMYGLERAGRISAQRFIGGEYDWYREGANVLLNTPKRDRIEGFWRGSRYGEESWDVTTSFALLFLSKGRWPVLLSKIRHGQATDWNRHRDDAANLTQSVEAKWNRNLTWQTVDLGAVTSPEELLVSPVLYFSGRDGIKLDRQHVELLRMYINRGGFIFADACCGGEGFNDDFRELMKQVFPEPEYRLQLLPPSHPIWRAEEPVDPDFLRPLYGIDVGCRTSVVYSPDNLSCHWELGRYGRTESYPERIEKTVHAALTIGINVLAYATNRELKFKDEVPIDAAEVSRPTNTDRFQIQVAKLRHPGGCDAAPVAVANIMQLARDELNLPTDSAVPLLSLTDAALFDYHLVFMHGRNSFRLTAAERQQLRLFVERGGTVIADSICSNDAFTESFRHAMEETFSDKALERIPASHPLFSTRFGGAEINQVGVREPSGSQSGSIRSQLRQTEPELEGISFGDRLGVIFSRYDISCALEGHRSLECKGYVREDAARIAMNAILYALQH